MLFPHNMTFPEVEVFCFELETWIFYTSSVTHLLSVFPNVQDVVLVVPKHTLVFDAPRVKLEQGRLRSVTLNGKPMDLASCP